LRGQLHRLSGGPRVFRGIYSDFRRHDMGPDFCETQYDGSRNRAFRSAPLWGVGSTAPYGHDGASLCLDDVIRRHGGEGLAACQAYVKLPESEREKLLYFLQGLVLYSTETLPCDINGDGRIDEHFIVAGQDTGGEVLNPEWLFRHPGRIEGPVEAPDGGTIISKALVNLKEAYRLALPGLCDSHGEGFADILGMDKWRRTHPARP
jgi:hypothetical protein